MFAVSSRPRPLSAALRFNSSRLEAEISVISKELGDPELYLTRDGVSRSAELGVKLERLKRELDRALERWAAATEAAATLE